MGQAVFPFSANPEFQQAMVALYRGDLPSLDAAVGSMNDSPSSIGPPARVQLAGATLLHLAAEAGQETAVELLLRRGAPARCDRRMVEVRFRLDFLLNLP